MPIQYPSEQEFKNAFKTEQGSFSWPRWYQTGEYPQLKNLLKKPNLSLSSDVWSSGKCANCGAGVAVQDVVVLVPNEHGGKDTITLLSRFRDPCVCDLNK